MVDLSKQILLLLYVTIIVTAIIIVIIRLTKGYGNQCCYDRQGDIIVGPPGGSTVDKVAPRSIRNKINHFFEDVLPFMWCCKGEFSNCRDTYYRFRPSDDGSRYMPPPPGEITKKIHAECIIYHHAYL